MGTFRERCGTISLQSRRTLRPQGLRESENTRMKKVLSPLLLLLTGCASAAGQRPQEFRGFYEYGFEVESFRLCGSDERWWVVRGDELNRRYRELTDAPYQRVYAEIRGQAGPAGRYGHMAAYTRQLTVVEVLEVRRTAPDPCR